MKKIIGAVVMGILLSTTVSLGFADEGAQFFSKDIRVFVDTKPVEFKDSVGYPIIVSGRTLVPVRVISESMGYRVTWFEKEQRVYISDSNTEVEFQIGNADTVRVNGKNRILDKRLDGSISNTGATVINGRTYVPLRFITEAMGCKASWYAKSRTVNITTGDKPEIAPPDTEQDKVIDAKIIAKKPSEVFKGAKLLKWFDDFYPGKDANIIYVDRDDIEGATIKFHIKGEYEDKYTEVYFHSFKDVAGALEITSYNLISDSIFWGDSGSLPLTYYTTCINGQNMVTNVYKDVKKDDIYAMEIYFGMGDNAGTYIVFQ